MASETDERQRATISTSNSKRFCRGCASMRCRDAQRDDAKDLVHDTVIRRSPAATASSPAPICRRVFRIQRNEFISACARRPSVRGLGDRRISVAPAAAEALVVRSSCRPSAARYAARSLLLAVPEGTAVIAQHTGVSVGTVKSRISRARDMLERLLLEGDVQPRPAARIEKPVESSASASAEAERDASGR